jgi:hypothetical protein
MKRPTWPDGTPKSIANSFSAHKTGERSIFAQDTQFKLHTGRFKTSQRAAVVLATRHSGTYSKAGPV